MPNVQKKSKCSKKFFTTSLYYNLKNSQTEFFFFRDFPRKATSKLKQQNQQNI